MAIFERETITTIRAEQIRDPIERLRFLRKHGAAPPTAPRAPVPKRFRKWWAVGALASVAVSGTAAWTVYRLSHAPAIRVAPLILPPPIPGPAVVKDAGGIWLVDRKDGVETYSNGLRVEERYAIGNTLRTAFPVFDTNFRVERYQSAPAGIVYHTTESELAPFEPDHNRMLQRIGHEVLEFVREKRAYHFLIDRFGRVFRIVQESDVAYHAGNSVWGSAKSFYVNLNGSFLGIAFEMQTRSTPGANLATPAQIHAARILTDMLRAKYRIPAENCVTHAQVSINPSRLLIGYHTDWADDFPFEQMGLPNNYLLPPAGMTAFGFEYDPTFLESTGAGLLPALLLAGQQLRSQAAAEKISIEQLRSRLQSKYRELAAATRPAGSASPAHPPVTHEESKQ